MLKEKSEKLAIQHTKEKASRDICEAINKWRKNKRQISNRRWIFELIQNAIDTAIERKTKHLIIEIDYDKDSLIFKHNGGYFLLEEVNAIMYGGSRKPYDTDSPLIGRFGTGLLVTHVLNIKLEVKGFIFDEDDDKYYKFSINLNRPYNIERVLQNIDDCHSQLDNVIEIREKKREFLTEYHYKIEDNISRNTVEVGVNELKKNLPFIFIFNEIIKTIRINEEIYEITDFNEDVYSIEDEESNLQVGIIIQDNRVISLVNYPNIYLSLPLINTSESIHLPFVMNCTNFISTSERAFLDNNENNRNLVEKAFELYKKIIENLKEEVEDRYNLIDFQPLIEANGNELKNNLNEIIKESSWHIAENLPIVNTIDEQLSSIFDTYFISPEFNSEKFNNRQSKSFYYLVSQIRKDVPKESEYKQWYETLKNLESFEGLEFEGNFNYYHIEDLREKLEEYSNESNSIYLVKLGENLEIEKIEDYLISFYTFIDNLYKNGIISDVNFVYNLVPDQHDNTLVGSKQWNDDELTERHYIDALPNNFKEVLLNIGWDISANLLNNKFKKFEILKDLISEKMDVDLALRIIIEEEYCTITENDIQKDKVVDFNNKLASGWIKLFQWCVIKGKVKLNFPIITKEGSTIRKIKSLEKEQFFIPFDFIKREKNGIENLSTQLVNTFIDFEEVFPQNRFIHSIYFEDIDNLDEFINHLRIYNKAFVMDIPFYKDNLVIDGRKSIFLIDMVGKHEIEDKERTIGIIPFWKDIIKNLSNNPDKFLLVFQFILLIIQLDKYWNNHSNIYCKICKKNHTLRNSVYLANLIHDSWVPHNESLEKPTKFNIDGLIPTENFNEFLQINSDRIIELLSYLGYDKFDLSVKKRSREINIPAEEIRNEYSQYVLQYTPKELSNIISKYEGSKKLFDLIEEKQLEKRIENLISKSDKFENEFENFLEKVEKKDEESQVIQDNAYVGRIIEHVIKKIFKNKGFNVKTVHIGRDIVIWPENVEGWDMGKIEIIKENLNFEIEIKFTSIEQVRISKAQSERATEIKERYFILIIENHNNVRERLLKYNTKKSIPQDLQNEIIQYSLMVDKIFEELGQLPPDPEKVIIDLKGYWIKNKLYENKDNIDEWVQDLGKQLKI